MWTCPSFRGATSETLKRIVTSSFQSCHQLWNSIFFVTSSFWSCHKLWNPKKTCYIIILIMPQSLESRQLCQNMLCGWIISCSQEFGFLGANLDDIRQVKVGGVTWGHFWRFSLFMEQATCALSFFQIYPVNLCTTVTLFYGKNPHPNRASYVKHIGSQNGFLHLSNMELPPKTSKANLTKNPTCLEYVVFICYLAHVVFGTTLR